MTRSFPSLAELAKAAGTKAVLTFEAEGAPKPVCVAEILSLLLPTTLKEAS